MNSTPALAPGVRPARSRWAAMALPLLIVAALLGKRLYMNVRSDDPLPVGFVQYSDSSWRRAIAGNGLVLVDVYARWCPTCLAQHRVLSSLLADPRYGNVQGIRVDFDRDLDYRRVHNVPAQSTILFFWAGRELSRSVGVTNAEAIRQQLDRALLVIAEPPR